MLITKDKQNKKKHNHLFIFLSSIFIRTFCLSLLGFVVYKHGKIQAQNGNSGQFVTRTKNVCYDSDKHGYTVGNGSLHLVSQSGNTSKYAGPCYYGEECSYTFFDDKGILNISDFAGNVYVYKRSSSPNGRTTCSLIASKRSSVGSYIPSDNTVSSSRPNSRSHSSRTPQTRQRKRCTKCIRNPGVCPTCNGTVKKVVF